MRDYLLIYINGERKEIRGERAFSTLADFLREKELLTGTKIVCAEGDCGACTVLKSDTEENFQAINSCIATLVQLDGSHILTIESLAHEEYGLNEVQKAMRACHASQCGFCTPGFVMAMSAYFENTTYNATNPQKIKNQLTGNLCRCTGYQPIIDAGLSIEVEKWKSLKARYHTKKIQLELKKARKESLQIDCSLGKILAPAKTNELLKQYKILRTKNKATKVLAGGTDLGVLVNKGKLYPAGTKKFWLSTHLPKDLQQIKVDKSKILVGASVRLATLEKVLEKKIPEFADLLKIFASPQIKNIATLVGNIANGSPIGDTLPALFALDARLKIQSQGKSRWVKIDHFYKGYKIFDLKSYELITHLEFQIPKKNAVVKFYKVSHRKDLDISYISAAYLLEQEKGEITKARIAYGGMAGTVLRLEDLEKTLLGKTIHDKNAFYEIAKKIPTAMSPRSDVRGSALGRSILSVNLFKKFCLEANL